MFSIIITTLKQASWIFPLIGFIVLFIELTYFVATYDDRKPPKKKLAWDLYHDTRYINLE